MGGTRPASCTPNTSHRTSTFVIPYAMSVCIYLDLTTLTGTRYVRLGRPLTVTATRPQPLHHQTFPEKESSGIYSTLSTRRRPTGWLAGCARLRQTSDHLCDRPGRLLPHHPRKPLVYPSRVLHTQSVKLPLSCCPGTASPGGLALDPKPPFQLSRNAPAAHHLSLAAETRMVF